MSSKENPRIELRAYLETLRGFRLSHKRPEGYVYVGMEDFLLQHGKFFAVPKKSSEFIGVPRACFANARWASRLYGWRYVEGIALSIIPVHHAWCLDEKGKVQEVTWETPGKAYFGTIFRRPRGHMSILDNYKDQFKFYRTKFQELK